MYCYNYINYICSLLTLINNSLLSLFPIYYGYLLLVKSHVVDFIFSMLVVKVKVRVKVKRALIFILLPPRFFCLCLCNILCFGLYFMVMCLFCLLLLLCSNRLFHCSLLPLVLLCLLFTHFESHPHQLLFELPLDSNQ